MFEPFLHQLGYRLAHVQRRMLPIAMHLLQKVGHNVKTNDFRQHHSWLVSLSGVITTQLLPACLPTCCCRTASSSMAMTCSSSEWAPHTTPSSMSLKSAAGVHHVLVRLTGAVRQAWLCKSFRKLAVAAWWHNGSKAASHQDQARVYLVERDGA
jgi:hypothetical protein